MSTATSIPANFTKHHLPKIRLTLAVAGVIAALFVIDVSLEKTEQTELAQSALRDDRNGHALLQQGKTSDAVDQFRKAHALERENVGYEIDLINALMDDGKLAEAEPLVAEVLEEESNDGEVNLVAARLAARQGRVNSADAYYHRAIYGEWPSDVTKNQIQVRLELISFLLTHSKRDEILAELLPLQEQARKDEALQPRLASLFLEADSPGRALDIYRELAKQHPRNASYFSGMGQADLALGDFRAAHAAFAAAVARDNRDPTLRKQLELAMQLSNMDPTPRWLSSQDKYVRSLHILDLTTTGLQQCITNHPQFATDDATQLISTAQTQLSAPPPNEPTNQMAENTVALAQRIWQTRTSLCGPVTADDEEPLRYMMEKLASAK